MDLLLPLTHDPRIALENAEKKFIGRQVRPSELRRMAAGVREEARRMEEAAERAHHRADVYEDLAAERERA